MFFFWYKPEERMGIERELRRIGRTDLIAKLYDGVPYHGRAKYDHKAIGSSPDMPKRGRQEKGGRDERRQAQGRGRAQGQRDEWRQQDQRQAQGSRQESQQRQKPKRASFNPNFHPKSKNRR